MDEKSLLQPETVHEKRYQWLANDPLGSKQFNKLNCQSQIIKVFTTILRQIGRVKEVKMIEQEREYGEQAFLFVDMDRLLC